jgi:hypothetical protein
MNAGDERKERKERKGDNKYKMNLVYYLLCILIIFF